MANNRLWAVCKHCNKAKVMMKYYPVAWYFIKDNNKELEDFINNHGKIHKLGLQWGEFIDFVTEEDSRVDKYDFTDYENPKIFLKS